MEELDTKSIEEQIKKDLKECEYITNLFGPVEVISAYEFPEYPTFPLIVIEEIRNTENTKYSTSKGETATNLSYLITSLCGTTQLKTKELLPPGKSSKLLMIQINKLLGGEKYKMQRGMRQSILPLKEDNTVMCCEQIYETVLFNDTLYRK